MPEITTKVTLINNVYHCRVYDGDEVLDEMACKEKADIGFCMAEMLRWQNKLGSNSNMADKARDRMTKKSTAPIGKIWHKNKLPI